MKKKLIAGILSAVMMLSSAAAAGVDPELVGTAAVTEETVVTLPETDTAAAEGLTVSSGLPEADGLAAAESSASPVAAAAKETAYPANMTVKLNGTQVRPVGYNIKGNNYYKLRDIAALLSGTTSQFDVGYDDSTRAIRLTSGKAYTTVGGELGDQPTETQTATLTTSAVTLDGKSVSLTAYNVRGNNYFKLVDIGDALGFAVGYDAASRTVLMNTPPEVPEDPEQSGNGSDSETTPEQPEEPEEPETPVVTPSCIDGELRIWIDAGHGGSDAGTSGTASMDFIDHNGNQVKAGTKIYEKDFNLAVALYLQELLEDEGVDVRMTRTDDTTVTADERKQMFSTEGGAYDMIFSVHHNSATPTATGAELLIQIAYENGGRGQEFGDILKQKYLDMGQTFRRFVFQHSTSNPANDYYFVLRSAQEGGALAFISEFCFLSNSEDQKWVMGEDKLRAQAQAQCDAILEYFETHEY